MGGSTGTGRQARGACKFSAFEQDQKDAPGRGSKEDKNFLDAGCTCQSSMRCREAVVSGRLACGICCESCGGRRHHMPTALRWPHHLRIPFDQLTSWANIREGMCVSNDSDPVIKTSFGFPECSLCLQPTAQVSSVRFVHGRCRKLSHRHVVCCSVSGHTRKKAANLSA